tara:strand:- start:40 stop:660 length:621 start_codon:yes stop_codon:yes gene_type:complete
MSFQKILDNLDDESLNNSLSKSLRLAKQKGLSDFENWLQLELLGYTNNNDALNEKSEVPEYRSVTGRHLDQFGRPILVADDRLLFLNDVRLRNSISELERLSTRDETVTIQDPNIIQFLKQHFEIEPYAFQFSSVQLLGVLNAIKTRLSDYLLKHIESIEDVAVIETQLVPKKESELFELKPGIWGFSINLKVLARKWLKLFKKKA